MFFLRHALSASHRVQDVYLYYFLLRYPGRTLVFMSSIDGIRRLAPLLELLGLPTFPLHSQLEQRQRLKNLDRCVPDVCLVLTVINIARHQLQVTYTLYPARD